MAIAIEAAFHGPGATMDNYFKSLEILGTAPEAPIRTQAVSSTG
jgi:hypothetical protein